MRELLAVLCCLASFAAAQEPAREPAPVRDGRIEGLLLGQQGEPLPNVEVVASYDGVGGEVLARGRTDAEGVFVLAHLPCERGCRVIAHVPGHTTALGYVSLGPDARQGAVRLRVWQANKLRGRVVDADGRPVVGAGVIGRKDLTWFDGTFWSPEARTDEHGRFELPGVPIGDCVVMAWGDGYRMTEHWLTAVEDAEIEVKLLRGGGTRLRVQIEGMPEDAGMRPQLSIYPTRGGSGFSMPRDFAQRPVAATGAVLDGLLEAEWNVSPSAPGFTFEPRSVRTKSDDHDAELKFRAVPDGQVVLRGTLHDDQGKPLAGQRLLCRTQNSQSMNGGRPGEAVTVDDGRWQMTAPLVEAEPYSLHLVDSPWVLDQRVRPEKSWGNSDARYLVRWEEQADPQRELQLVAVRGVQIDAKLVFDDGRPVSFVWTELQMQRPPNWSPRWGAMAYGTSTVDGTVSFPPTHPVDEGLRILAESAAGLGVSEPFRAEGAKRHSFTVVVQRPGCVTGIVRDDQGSALPGVRVSIGNYDLDTRQQRDGSWSTVPTDRDGKFVFVGVAPGGHRLMVGNRRANDGKGQSELFAVESGATVTVDLVVTPAR